MNNISPPFDEAKYYLGKPCPRGHLFADTGKTLKLRIGRDCPECKRLRTQEWMRNNPKRYRRIARAKELRASYGLSRERYEQMLTAQDGKCAICEQPPDGKELCVDHCHASGEIRGLLCGPCNRGLGAFRDDVTALRQAIAYLS